MDAVAVLHKARRRLTRARLVREVRKPLARNPLYFRAEYRMRRLLSRCGTVSHTIQITSFGGCGTTLLHFFLLKRDANIPRSIGMMPWKHMPAPPLDSQVRGGVPSGLPVWEPHGRDPVGV